MTTTQDPPQIFLVSDATGDTVEKVTSAALLQFPEAKPRLRGFHRVRTAAEVRNIVERARDEKAFISYTLADLELRSTMQDYADSMGVISIDVIGAMMVRLSTFFGHPPVMKAGITMVLNEEYFRRIEAVEFAVKNDDGQEPRNLSKADLVLVGVSRTSKTPLSTYLAHKGYKVANVPLVPDVPAPRELFEVDQGKVIALTIDPGTLTRIRQERLRHLGMPADSAYGLKENVVRELKWVEEFFAAHPQWPVLNVSGKAVEETAAEILAYIARKKEGGEARP
ncbi:MAG: kinase/pyrophosphorylase [Deltaproteobacteria bacterium]|nr:kinase/pyrophosphorylase [Deltaproteobacteria bacterium]